MKLTEKFKSYKFWEALTSAVIIFLQTLGKEFGFSISEETITNIVLAFCGILVLLGFINDDRNTPSIPSTRTNEHIGNEDKPSNAKNETTENEEIIPSIISGVATTKTKMKP